MVTDTRKPTVFVLSSTESGDIRDVLVDCPSSVADVIPWNREDLWQPGEFIAARLLDFPYRYDFAIAIFSAEDKSFSRGREEYQPRDNVIFETGMFMSHLGMDRTFIMLPETPPVKVLTDLVDCSISF
jgi:predicted nucleotide-binding protein